MPDQYLPVILVLYAVLWSYVLIKEAEKPMTPMRDAFIKLALFLELEFGILAMALSVPVGSLFDHFFGVTAILFIGGFSIALSCEANLREREEESRGVEE